MNRLSNLLLNPLGSSLRPSLRLPFKSSSRFFSMTPSPSPTTYICATSQDRDVWSIFTPLSIQHQSVNLGQGFPNFPAADWVKSAASQAIYDNFNQYAPTRGLPHLLSALAHHYGHGAFGSRTINPATEVIITQGANQALLACLQAFLHPGESVLLMEPFFDIYKYHVEILGGKVVAVPLILEAGSVPMLDFKMLESKIVSASPPPKILILNTPHNPTGKVFTTEELQKLAELAIRYNILVLSDEVYDHLIYQEGPMPRIAALPGMWQRTLSIGSAGKTFGVTGWRIGWVFGHADLIQAVLKVQTRTVFCSPTPFQESVARCFDDVSALPAYLADNVLEYRKKRDFCIDLFSKDLKLPIIVPEGSYFLLVNIKSITPATAMTTDEGEYPAEYGPSLWMTHELKVTSIPCSAFYLDKKDKMSNRFWVRICFAKTWEDLNEAKARLLKIRTKP